MKGGLSLLLVISLLFIGLFGFSALEHGMNHGQSNCTASLISAIPCPPNIMGVMEHHISAIQELFNVPLGSLMMLVLILCSMAFLLTLFLHSLRPPSFVAIRDTSPPELKRKNKFLHWLSLFENSPSF